VQLGGVAVLHDVLELLLERVVAIEDLRGLRDVLVEVELLSAVERLRL